MRSLRRGASLLILLLLLSACGRSGGGVEVSMRPLVLSAVRASTEAEGTARTSFVIRMSFSGLPDETNESFEMTAEGAVDIVNQRGRFVVDMPAAPDDEDARLAGPVEIIIDGTTGYIRLPDSIAPPGTPWLRSTEEAFAMDGSLSLGGLGAALDPGLGLDLLLGEADDIDTIGREDIRGASTVHYRVTTKLPEEPLDDDADSFAQRMFGAGQSVTYDVWVDDEDRLRKLAFSVDLFDLMRGVFEAMGDVASEFSADGTTTTIPEISMVMETEVEAWDYGAAVDIQLPPADQVFEDDTFDF